VDADRAVADEAAVDMVGQRFEGLFHGGFLVGAVRMVRAIVPWETL
jgi:hypothetical protein